MVRSVSRKLTFVFALLAASLVSAVGSTQADVIDIDISQVDPSAIPVIRAAEAFWETRIQAYSRELPRAITDQLTSLRISATVAPIDGVGGILGFAGPDAVLSVGAKTLAVSHQQSRPYVVAVSSSMTFDLDDFPSMAADGILFDVIRHEMGHALGVGSLWELNELIAPLGGVGLTQYTTGRYGIEGYRKGIGNPVASYIPLEQRGGPGTALGHWNDFPPYFNQVFTPAFTKELMTGFACDLSLSGPVILICAPKFVSEATWGSAADLGFAVKGINNFPARRGNGTGRWPKVTGPTVDPFNSNGVLPTAGIRFDLVKLKNVYRHSVGSVGSGADDVGTDNSEDPYNLRKHRWSK